MVRPIGCLLTAMLGGFLLTPGLAFAQNKTHANQGNAAADASRPSDPTKPGPEHASLTKRAGEYTRVVKFLGQPGAAGAPFTGTAKFSVVLGGRFLLEESTDTVFGRPVEGMRLYGYNNVTKQYEMVRMYTMSTGITIMTGTSKDGGKTIDFTGSSDTSAMGKMPLQAQLRQVDDDQLVVTLSTTGPDGKESAFQETTYTRKK